MEKETTVHVLKTWEQYFFDVLDGKKTFELRKNDRDFKIGDELLLECYDGKKNKYLNASTRVKITYILEGGNFGLEKGYVILGIKPTL